MDVKRTRQLSLLVAFVVWIVVMAATIGLFTGRIPV